jgi:large subunit ribosomal protein L15
MRLGEIKSPPGSRKTRKRLGQGSGSGTGKTAGKGHKGQRSRSGAKRGSRIGFEGGQMATYRHMPKIGFSNHNFKTTYQIVNLGDIEQRELDGDIGPVELTRAGLIKKVGGKIKILGHGDLSRALTVKAHKFSKSATEKLEEAGGKAEVI